VDVIAVVALLYLQPRRLDRKKVAACTA